MSQRGALAVVVVTAMAACGGGGSSGEGNVDGGTPVASEPTPTEVAASPTPPPPPVGVAGASFNAGVLDVSGETGKTKVTLKMDEGDGRIYFEPTYVKVAPGTEVAVTLDNVGGAEHNFTVESQKIDVDIAAGKQGKANVVMPAKDGLRFFCNLHPPMAGAFYSEEGQEVQR